MTEVRDIVKSYDKLRVLDGVSLDIGRGEIVAVTRPSGAGKTTLLQIVGTLGRAFVWHFVAADTVAARSDRGH